jgi:hypothetical protein
MEKPVSVSTVFQEAWSFLEGSAVHPHLIRRQGEHRERRTRTQLTP